MMERKDTHPKSNTKKLGECFTLIRNGANIKQSKEAGGIPITRIETLSNGIFNRDRFGYADINDANEYSSYILNDGDILMSHINSLKFLGRAVLYKKQEDEIIIHGMNLLILIANKHIIDPAFITYYFKCHKFQTEIFKIAKQSVNQASFNISSLKQIPIPVPPLPVQARIVRELDCLQGILSKKRQQLAEYHSLAQAIFHQMFGDPVVNEKGWEVKRLGEVAPKRKNAVIVQIYNNKVWLLNLDKIQPHTGAITEKEYLSIEEIGSSVNQFSKDDILYSKLRPYLNKVVIPNSSGYCTSELIPLTPNPTYLNKTYLAYLLRNTSFVDFISGKVAGAKMPRVVMSSLTSFETPLPPIKLQEKFAELINAIDNQCERLALSIHETEDLLACRMETLLACRMETLLNCPQA